METQRYKILVVDDEPIAIEILKNILGDEFEIETAEDGKNGLLKAVEFQPDLMLLDVRMPELDGWEVCRQIKQSRFTDGIKVVMISAYAIGDRDRLAGYKAGADVYLPKPCIQRDLLKRMLEQE